MAEFIEIEGIGQVEVSSKPDNIPSKVQIGNKSVKINKQLYLWLWANAYGTADGQRRLGALV